jgi:flagellar hook-length control protein FliK
MNQILAALLNTQPANAAQSSTQASSDKPSSAETRSGTQFKLQFDRAIKTFASIAQANAANPSRSHGSPATQGAAQATSGASAEPSASATDSLQAGLQKKIADLLAAGKTVTEIVQQLAGVLAHQIAQQFGGSQADIRNQLQTAFVSALTPPTGTGPPSSTADLASALAQRFRQAADVAAGVLGETGQSNRLFAGSILDAATTAGVQPAPTTTVPSPSAQAVSTPTTNSVADSMAQNAQALLAALTAPQGDGKTVATNGVTTGPNGDTLLGRMLARAQQAAQDRSAAQAPAQTPLTIPTGSSTLTTMALAAATVSLSSANALSAPDPSAAAGQRIVANVNATMTDSSAMPVTEAAPSLSPAVTAFLKSFAETLALANSAAPAKTANGNGAASTSDPGTLLPTTVDSSQAPTIGAFAPVQAAIGTDAASTSSQAPAQPSSFQPAVHPGLVVDQLLHGVFMTTADASTVRIRLRPESLGDISVKLTIDGNNVAASVMAQTPAAHDALVAGQLQLARTLADAGLKLSSFTVDLAGGFASFQQQQQSSSQNGPSNGRTGLLGGVDTPETDENTLVAAPNFGPPVMAANQNWAALNYLV